MSLVLCFNSSVNVEKITFLELDWKTKMYTSKRLSGGLKWSERGKHTVCAYLLVMFVPLVQRKQHLVLCQ